jgi:porin
MCRARVIACLALCLQASAVSAQQADNDLWTRTNLLGDLGGIRTSLGDHGLTFGVQNIDELLANVSGGTRRGASYDGVTLLGVGLDTQKAGAWDGGTFNVDAFIIRGRNISTDNLLNLQTASGFLASPTTRLWEAWYQQSILGGAIDVRLGQQSLDQEFTTSQYAALFVNTAMGWAVLPSVDLYAGGPAYPLSSLGVRVRGQPAENVTALLGVFDDNPPGGPFNADSQLLGTTRWGANVSLRTGALIIGEVQYALNPLDKDGKATTGLPGTYKLGAWFDTAPFPDQRFDNTGLSLANPASNGIALMHRNNFSIYAVADQMVWRPAPDSPRSIGVFARVMGAPGDRNLVNFSANGGISLKAPFAGRDSDTFGIGFGVARIGGAAQAVAGDAAFFSGTPVPARTVETFIEVTYQIQVSGWWQVQPDFQYVFRPGAGVVNPANPPQRVGDEAILGVRSIVTF